MGFKEELLKLSIQINERKAHIVNEEMTKQSLIIPFIQVLGYDVFNPLEVKPEYIADFGMKKGEKVDYAVYKGDEPIMFVEAKPVNANLVNYDAQLSRYFNAVPQVKLAIITNGVEYKFFTDLKTPNVMDELPFLVLNLTNLKDSDIDVLARFKKDTYTKDELSGFAEELVYTSAVNDLLKAQFKNPSDEFVKFLLKEVGVTRVMAKDIERFRPIVLKAISNSILDIVSQGLIRKEPGAVAEGHEATAQDKSKDIKPVEEPKPEEEPMLVTYQGPTEDELRAFEIVKTVLAIANRDIKDLNYKDTSYYFSINNRTIIKWFMRVNLTSTNKNVVLRLNQAIVEQLAGGFKVEPAPKGLGETRIYLNGVDDLRKLDKLILACFDEINKVEAIPVIAQ